jgi:hypothetical protein
LWCVNARIKYGEMMKYYDLFWGVNYDLMA